MTQHADKSFCDDEQTFFASDLEPRKLLTQSKAFLCGEGTLVMLVDNVRAVAQWQGERAEVFA